MDQRRAPLAGPDQHYHRPSLPNDQSVPPSNQHIYPPPRPHSLPSVDSLHPPPPPSHQYHGPQPPSTVIHPAPHPEGSDRADHPNTAPPAVHGTPLIKSDVPPAPPQYPRPPSNPLQSHPHPQSQQQHHPGQPPNSRPPMDHPQVAYAHHPQHPQGEHVNYVVAPMLDPYGQPPPGYYPQHIQYMNPTMQMTNPNSRKKSMRASQACDRCRERKSKCDENRPCATCKDQNLECIYKDTHPTKADKSNQALSDMVTEVLMSIKTISDRLGVVENHLALGNSTLTRVDTPNGSSQNGSSTVAVALNDSVELAGVQQQSWELGEHTTAAHKLLLRWPSIQPFVRTSKCNIQENYVMKGEDRGLLRLYGAGERDRDDKAAIGAASPAGSASGEDLIASTPENDSRRSEPFTPGSPAMAMDIDTIDNLFISYKKNIHRLHPFVDVESFGRYLKEFQQKHCAEVKYAHSPLFVSNGSGEREAKRRKRNDNYAVGLLPGDYPSSSASLPPKRAPDRTITNAIVYLVLALGKICEAGDPLPGPVQELGPVGKANALQGTMASPVVKPSASSPRQYLSNVANSSAGVTRAQSCDGTGNQISDRRQAQNIEKIAGFVYYREAASILGDFTDSNELAAAQARLLAGLYKGQLARVQESWSWINTAARTCLYRMKIDGLDNSLEKMKKKKRALTNHENLTILAFWSALQLESDILAEWDYPRSGLHLLEKTVIYPEQYIPQSPNWSQDEREKYIVTLYYSAQLYLRTKLNQIHTGLYGGQLSAEDPRKLADLLWQQEEDLQGWQTLMPTYCWSDDDPPASDIVVARLRGKYYGARYVCTRPYLDFALHVMPGLGEGKTIEELTRDANGKQRETELALFTAINMYHGEEDIKSKCRICIDAALRSTVAFDGVENFDHRLIVTNIMGTAHAQFGNMLVLAAVYNCKIDWLEQLVSKDKLQSLLHRTIAFIRRLQHASSVAVSDILILEAIDRTLFPDGTDIYKNEGLTGDSLGSGDSFNSIDQIV
ncbi:hypothetical protein AUEXF2481DRAFT_25614 [Aureobasidium subglaciale EXF-2481]|uniref:Zn(2)-C6 fungal-type domain-containing protein n=1 Tax=Aureobasidium subglaciale (strain EXF-2481) TaxID=1043005 RepID=A0A074YU91_AURSE|nr:uncharacterized protein AUEXF2481DRAFT_25614 [Aureobasidium subglaciale EXF-2481]KAI5204651.1 hypothetical protein E4T38_04610 [Aureobasidium subglaciale]KAI5223735.1 hypothetical protein E4T40_04386 [Aureobasidium subglaciale]KAI5227139.1 hypothetical protein E4T41_04489 [Aureobasidium subglaciale]KAI5262617.1 hypothetical protein E4T46_04375 [Aureobasidium subglaciale]KEQ99729.1 hypothetical protein AUEXF2481DRAFT_25614 [Aureobasidium subglaciale EXF-2481]